MKLTGNILATESYLSCALLLMKSCFKEKNSAHCITEIQKVLFLLLGPRWWEKMMV